jgi:hypothetical protein
VKRLIVLLVLLAAGLAAAALSVPTNAAVVNGTAISQQTLNSDVDAIAGSTYYQCYLNSQEYLSSQGQEALPPVTGAGKGQDAGDHPTATTAFVASYLDTVIGHQLIIELADQRHVTLTSAQLADARSSLTLQISSVMSEILQTPEGENPRYGCTVTGRPITGEQVLQSMPASFVDDQVQFVATATALQEDLAGIGSSDADLQRYYEAHRAEFDTGCFDAAEFSSEDAAKTAAATVDAGTTLSQAAGSATEQGTIPCGVLSDIAGQLQTSVSNLSQVPVGKASAPIDLGASSDGSEVYLVVVPTKRSATPFDAAKSAVSTAAQAAGTKATETVLTAAERRASVSVDPRYGTWVPVTASVFVPFTPEHTDVLNPSANEVAATPSSGPSGG